MAPTHEKGDSFVIKQNHIDINYFVVLFTYYLAQGMLPSLEEKQILPSKIEKGTRILQQELLACKNRTHNI